MEENSRPWLKGRHFKGYWKRTSSEVWRFFRFEVDDDGEYFDKNVTVCLLCGLGFSFCGSTTNMLYHLKRKHPDYENETVNIQSFIIKQEFDESGKVNNFIKGHGQSFLEGDNGDETPLKIFKSYWGDTSNKVWDFFKFEINETGHFRNINNAHCMLCEQDVGFHGDISNLIGHLNTSHPGYETMDLKEEEELPALTISQEEFSAAGTSQEELSVPGSSQEELSAPGTSQEELSVPGTSQEAMVKQFVEKCAKEIKLEGGRVVLPNTELSSNPQKGKKFIGFWGNATSAVWDHFKFEADIDGNYVDKNVIHCMKCFTKLKYCHNTTNMAYHLERKHNIYGNKSRLDYRRFGQPSSATSSTTDHAPSPRNVETIEPEPIPTVSRDPEMKNDNRAIFVKKFVNKTFMTEGDILIDGPKKFKSIWGNTLPKVWHYFLFEVDGKGKCVDKAVTYCKLCGLQMIFMESTAPLVKHLRQKHHSEYYSSGSVVLEEEVEIPVPKPYTKPKVVVRDELEISAAIAKFLIEDVKPLSLLESKSFREMCGVLCSYYTLPSKLKFKSEVLMPLYTNKQKKVLKDISATFQHCINLEWWTSDSKNDYVSVKVHYIDEAWNYHKCLIHTMSIQKQPSSKFLAKKLLQLSKEWQLKNPVFVTNSSYIETTIANNNLKWPNIPGLNHTVDMAVSKILALNEINELLSKIRIQFSHLQKIAHLIDVRQRQFLLHLPEKDLFQEFTDHWTSTLEMLTLYIDQEPFFKSVIIDYKLEETLILNQIHMKKVRDLVEILQVLKTATAYLSSEGQHTVSVVLPVTLKLKACLRVHSQENGFVCIVKKRLMNTIEESYKSEEIRKILISASALDPRMKKLAFLSKADQNMIREKISQEAVAMANEKQDEDSEDDAMDGAPRPKVPRTSDSMSDWLGDIVSVERSQLTTRQKVDSEMRMFLTEPDVLFEDSPIHWWQRRWHTYPLISAVATKYMCIPATGLECENKKVKELRKTLDSEVVNIQLFLCLNS